MSKRYVGYIRCSTQAQNASGLGLDAQRAAVARYAASVGGTVASEHMDVESGRKTDRAGLRAALAECRATKATLLIARLDRLARNVAFVANLMDSGVEFVCCDMPSVTRLTLHVLAAVAEEEARLISARTKAALAAARDRGVRLGNPHLQPGNAEVTAVARAAQTAKANAHAARVLPYITAAKAAGCSTLAEIAEALQARGIATSAGGATWTACAVSRVMARAA